MTHTRENLIARIREFATKEGGCPGRYRFQEACEIGSGTLTRLGGWKGLLAEACPEEGGVEAPAVVIPGDRSDADTRKIEASGDFLITSAVNNCLAEKGFLAACERWKAETQGKIVVNPILYQNPTRRDDEQGDDLGVWWDPALEPYMLRREIRPHPKLSIMPTKMAATANNPLPPRLDGRTQDRSAIYGHPQLMMRTVPNFGELPKVMWSSGAITEKDYSDTLTGDIADFHHSHSAIIAQVRGDNVYMRNVTWNGRSFIDLDREYTARTARKAPNPLALIMGDIHVGLTADNVMEATFGEKGLYTRLLHECLVLHDLADFKRCNRHEMAKRLSRAAMANAGEDLIEDELQMVADFIDNHLPRLPDVKVIRSNHDEFIMHWLQAGEATVDARNRKLYHKLCYQMLAYHEEHEGFPIPLEMALHGYYERANVEFLDYDNDFELGGVHLGSHGHLGPNGSRGTLRAYSRLGRKVEIGHGHGPGIFQGAHMVGMSAIYRHGYNIGPSGWHQAHGTLHADGKRQMNLILPDGTYCG